MSAIIGYVQKLQNVGINGLCPLLMVVVSYEKHSKEARKLLPTLARDAICDFMALLALSVVWLILSPAHAWTILLMAGMSKGFDCVGEVFEGPPFDACQLADLGHR